MTKNRRFRGRFLLLTKEHPAQEGKEAEPLSGFCRNKEEFDKAVLEGGTPKGYYLTAYSILLEEGRLSGFRRLDTEEKVLLSLDRGENVRFAYLKLMEEEHWFEDQTYVDTMNPEAVKAFVNITYEAYYRLLSDKFGSAVPAVFTDEPRIGKHPQPAFAETGEDITIPYTEYLAEQIRERCGMDALDMIPEFVWELPEGKKSRLRYLYREMTAECFVNAYMDQIGDWCRQKGIAFTGHVLGEDSLISQTMMLGDCMRCYRKMELPGIDVLCDNRELLTAKQAASVARQNGREGVVSELYGVTHWDCGFKTYKLQGDWQAALGVTVRVPHLSHMSLQGEAKRDWPASIFYQSPWYREFPYIEDYFARLNTVLTRGRAVVKIGVIHPVESMWLYFGPNDQTKEKREEQNGRFLHLVRELLYGNLDFDLIAESLLPGQQPEQMPETCSGTDDFCRKETGEALFAVGNMEYSAVIVPWCVTLRSTTLERLERFRDRGGKLIFLGEPPVLEDAEESERGRRLAQRSLCLSGDAALLEALKPEREIEIRKPDGSRADNLFYQLREDGNVRWLFICHVNPKENHLSVQEKYRVRLKGQFRLTCYDAMTGKIEETECAGDENGTSFEWRCYAQDSILLRLEREEAAERGRKEAGTVFGSECVYSEEREISEIDAFVRQEPNVLLLDYARCQVGDEPIWEKQEILRLDNALRRKFGFLLREGRMNQPWAMEEKEAREITLYYEIWSETEVKEVFLAIENPQNCKIMLNEAEADCVVKGCYVDKAISILALPELKKGLNHLTVRMKYHQKTELENLYLLGDFDVELRGSRAVVVKKAEHLFFWRHYRTGNAFLHGKSGIPFSCFTGAGGRI